MSKVQNCGKKNWKNFFEKKNGEKIFLGFFKFWIFKNIFKSVKSPASEKENVRFPDSPDFENLPDFRTGRNVR